MNKWWSARVQGNATESTPDLVRALVNSGLLLDGDSE